MSVFISSLLHLVRISLILATAGFLMGPSVSADDHYLVQDGAAMAEIITSADPSRATRFAAKELQSYIEKMSGVRLPIVSEPGGATTKVYVGKSRFTEELELKVDNLRDGAFRIASGKGWMALLGAEKDFQPIEPWGKARTREEVKRLDREWDAITGAHYRTPFHTTFMHRRDEIGTWEFDEAGTPNAVFEFLRSLGVRWYAPGTLGEVVPTLPRIKASHENRTVEPAFALRALQIYYTHMGLGDVSAWKAHLGLNPAGDRVGHVQLSHGMKDILRREEVQTQHPEWFALRDGVRNTSHRKTGVPCLSSPELLKYHVEYVRAVFDHYGERMISIDPPDGFGTTSCHCDKCLKQATPERGWKGSLSDYVWSYLNKVAQEVYKTHPDRMVSGLAYSAYQLPPEKIDTLSPNLAILECRRRSNFYDSDIRDEFNVLRTAWLKKLPSQEYYIRDYYLYNSPKTRGIPAYFMNLIAEDLRALKGISGGDMIEVYKHPGNDKKEYDPFAVDHLNLYVTSRTWWDPDLDLQQLLEEYYTLYYGPAREPMKAFIEFSQDNWIKMRNDRESIRKALDLLTKAQEAVEPESVYGRRISAIVQYVQPLEQLQQQLSRERATEGGYRVLVSQKASGADLETKKLDGKLDPTFWPPVRVARLARIEGEGQPLKGSFQILRRDDILYIGIRCEQPPAEETANQAESDRVTLLLETNSHSYYEISVDRDGNIIQRDHAPGAAKAWSSQAKAVVHHGENFWSAEVRLPIAGEGASEIDPGNGIDGTMPRGTYPWYFNVIRERTVNGLTDRYAYSVRPDLGIRDPGAFGRMWGK